MSKNKNTHLSTQTIAVLAILLATEIVLERLLSISTPIARIGFAFLPIALAARKYGPIGGMIVAGLGDVIGATMFPTGPFFPGFTLTALFTGACYGLFLHKQCNIKRIISAVLTIQIFGSLVLNTYWLSILYSKAYLALLPARILQTCILIVVQVITLEIVFKYMNKFEKTKSFQQN